MFFLISLKAKAIIVHMSAQTSNTLKLVIIWSNCMKRILKWDHVITVKNVHSKQHQNMCYKNTQTCITCFLPLDAQNMYFTVFYSVRIFCCISSHVFCIQETVSSVFSEQCRLQSKESAAECTKETICLDAPPCRTTKVFLSIFHSSTVPALQLWF